MPIQSATGTKLRSVAAIDSFAQAAMNASVVPPKSDLLADTFLDEQRQV